MNARLIILLVLQLGVVRAWSEDHTSRVLTLSQCIQLALQHNYDIQIERLSPEIAQFNLSGSYGVYQPSFNFGAGEQYLNQPSQFDPKKAGSDFPYQLTTDTLGFGISGLLPTGLSYDAQASSSYQKAATDFGLAPATAMLYPPDGIRYTNQYTSLAAVTLKQPLLKDFWIDANREKIWVNRKNLQISEMALRWQVMTIVNSVQQAFYDLVLAREMVRVEEHALELANQLLQETRLRVKVGSLPPLSEKQAESQLATVQTTLFAASQNLLQRQNALKRQIADDFQDWADAGIEPGDGLIAIGQIFDRAESWRNALESRPDLLQLRLELEKQGIIVRFNHNQLFPRLDLVGGYGLQGGANSLSGSLGDISSQTYPQYAYGVAVSIPLGNRTARNSYKASQATQQQAALRLKKMEQDILVQVDDSLNVAQSSYQRTNSAREARLYAEEALAAEERQLRDGRTTSFFVLEFQQKLTDARTLEIRSLVEYNKALAELALNEGTTLEKNHLNVEVK